MVTGRVLRSIEGVGHLIALSSDGKRLAGYRGNRFVVHDVEMGREIASLTVTDEAKPLLTYPMRFTPDGRVLLDSRGGVWDLETGKFRFKTPESRGNMARFTKDGQGLLVVESLPTDAWLAYRDLATGQEDPKRRIHLASGDRPVFDLSPATPDGRFLLALGINRLTPPSAFATWLSKSRVWRDWDAMGLTTRSS